MRIITFGIQRKIKAAEKMKKDAIVPDGREAVHSYLAKAPDKVGCFSHHFGTYGHFPFSILGYVIMDLNFVEVSLAIISELQYQHSQRSTTTKNDIQRRNSYHGQSGQRTYRFRRFRIKV